MYEMFNKASSFNQPLAEWNMSAVTNMGSMFYGSAMVQRRPPWYK